MPISPNQGPSGGGTSVIITGTNLSNASAVRFGTKPATITANSPTSVTVVSPSGSGVVDVRVTTPGGTSNPLPFFYVPAPLKTGVDPLSGPTAGGNVVTITGTGLTTASSVSFGASTAVPTVVNDGQLTVVVPAGAAAGPVGVSVTTAGGVHNGVTYVYVDGPTITDVDPASGPTSGGTAVTITGTSLTTTGSVTFGGNVAPFTVVSDSTVTTLTPPGAAGAVDVVLTNDGGSDTAVGAYTYVAGPGI
ncbi:IPT/TIG domain-containing protein [Streptomyces radicis]|uniref:Cell surface protein n=1 Tax=Streptomyces radicis TaxID=1750517 RepID=A0A3A9WGD9_9ACTN|nr:IPT/TIG domain-containing protein [Streptomyces radicis]RKN12025.1 cell surface protein [Streptomyces radicis]RKN25924.1 cell surface protein [Streptomyces radicis]